MKTDRETVSVHLGPSWYLENQDVKIEPKDKVEVKGSRIMFGDKPALIAGYGSAQGERDSDLA